jgi:hypothetical protein
VWAETITFRRSEVLIDGNPVVENVTLAFKLRMRMGGEVV